MFWLTCVNELRITWLSYSQFDNSQLGKLYGSLPGYWRWGFSLNSLPPGLAVVLWGQSHTTFALRSLLQLDWMSVMLQELGLDSMDLLSPCLSSSDSCSDVMVLLPSSSGAERESCIPEFGSETGWSVGGSSSSGGLAVVWEMEEAITQTVVLSVSLTGADGFNWISFGSFSFPFSHSSFDAGWLLDFFSIRGREEEVVKSFLLPPFSGPPGLSLEKVSKELIFCLIDRLGAAEADLTPKFLLQLTRGLCSAALSCLFWSCSSRIFLRLWRNQAGLGATGGPLFVLGGVLDVLSGVWSDRGSEVASVTVTSSSLIVVVMLWMFSMWGWGWWRTSDSCSGELSERWTQGSWCWSTRCCLFRASLFRCDDWPVHTHRGEGGTYRHVLKLFILTVYTPWLEKSSCSHAPVKSVVIVISRALIST